MFIFSFECDSIEEEMKREPFRSFMDFSNFGEKNPLQTNNRKGELGLLKSETAD